MKKILSHIVSAYVWLAAGSMFLHTTIFGIIFFNLFKPKPVNEVFKRLLNLVFVVAFSRVKLVNVPPGKGKTYLYMPNHTSIADVPLMGAYVPTFANAIEAQSHFKWPIYRHLLTAYGQIPINRDSVRDSINTMNIALERMKNGRSIIIFPEGHRTRTGEMQEFKKLPFVVAQKSGVPIVPISISGMWKLSPNDKFEKRPTRITMHFHDPIPPEVYSKMTADELKDKVFEIVKSGIIQSS